MDPLDATVPYRDSQPITYRAGRLSFFLSLCTSLLFLSFFLSFFPFLCSSFFVSFFLFFFLCVVPSFFVSLFLSFRISFSLCVFLTLFVSFFLSLYLSFSLYFLSLTPMSYMWTALHYYSFCLSLPLFFFYFSLFIFHNFV